MDDTKERGQDSSELSVVKAVAKILSSIADGTTPIDALTAEEISKQASAIGAIHGRGLKDVQQALKDMTTERDTLLQTHEGAQKALLEVEAEKASKRTGVPADLILEFGGKTTESLNAYADRTAKSLNVKPPEEKKAEEEKKKEETEAEEKASIETDSGKAVGSGEYTPEQLEKMPMDQFQEYMAKEESKRR